MSTSTPMSEVVSEDECDALRLAHQGDVRAAALILARPQGSVEDDLGGLKWVLDTITATAGILRQTLPTSRAASADSSMPFDVALRFVDRSLAGALDSWVISDLSQDERASLLAVVDRFISAVNAACVLRASVDLG